MLRTLGLVINDERLDFSVVGRYLPFSSFLDVTPQGSVDRFLLSHHVSVFPRHANCTFFFVSLLSRSLPRFADLYFFSPLPVFLIVLVSWF